MENPVFQTIAPLLKMLVASILYLSFLRVWTKTDKLSLCYYNFRTRQSKEKVAAAAEVVVVVKVFVVGTNGISTIKGIRLLYL